MILSIVAITSAVLITISLIQKRFIFPTFGIASLITLFFDNKTGIKGTVLSSRFKKYYEKEQGNIYFILALAGIGIAVVADLVFLLFLLQVYKSHSLPVLYTMPLNKATNSPS